MTLGIIIFIAAILVVVMIHELGHFLAARRYGFKATQLFLGFGPTLWSTTRGETEYGVKALPLGGFVKILGMNPYEEIAPEDEPRSYPNKPRWQRALVIVAGCATHWVVAFVALMITAMTLGFPTLTTTVASADTGNAGETTPASQAGFEAGDDIVAIQGDPVDDWEDVRGFIRDNPGESVTFTVERDGSRQELEVTLGSALSDEETELITDFAPPDKDLPAPGPGEEVVGFLGVAPDDKIQRRGLIGAVGEAGRQTWQITRESVLG
ncbi:MAG: M50 family metallopeptidase, partial [Actinomycetota bacterium]